MSSEENLIQIRKDKHQELNGGAYPLASDPSELPFIKSCPVLSLIEDLTARQEEGLLVTSIAPSELEMEPKYTIKGRISAFRKSGAITFIKLTDSTGSVQVILSKAAYPEYDSLKLLDLGDIVEAFGHACLSRTGEKSLLVFRMTLLTKSHRPPPEKFVGIADPELKYRKRYLDLMSSEESRARFITRSCIMRGIREFMTERSFIEVETSTLTTINSGANAKPFLTHHNSLEMDMRLRIAPELSLKRLLVGGLDRVYEIGRAYRNEGIDTRHNPEFTIMESYQAYGNFSNLLDFTKQLLMFVTGYCQKNLPNNVKPFFSEWSEACPFSFSFMDFVEVTMLGAVITGLQKAGLDFAVGAYFGRTPSGEAPAITDLHILDPNNPRLQEINMKDMFNALSDCESMGEQVAILFEFVAEPFLAQDYRTLDNLHSRPVFITEYPVEISPLARANDERPYVTDRFELFVEGRELANAFQELNDPDEQAFRLQEQLNTNSKDPMDYDADYVEALEHGMPPAIGFGIGIDRLIMLMTNTTSIKDVILFPTLKILK